ncbi:DUF2490 domain-containing protein [soil metagenome]
MATPHFIRPLLAAIALASPVAVQARDDSQLWLTGTAMVDLSKKWRVSEEAVLRFSDNRNGLYEVENNLLLGYRLDEKVTIWGGYTHDPLYTAGRFTVMEHRAREQVTADNVLKLGPGKISVRLRLEQRWREGVDGTAWRFRPFIRYAVPLGKDGITLQLSHESFIDLNETGYQRVGGEERMRNLIAVRTPLSKKINLEVGYLNQYGFVPGGEDSDDHVASLTLNFTL